MKLNTMPKILACLRDETPEIILSDEVMSAARKPIDRMLEISRQAGLI
jgi:quinolinate synthase